MLLTPSTVRKAAQYYIEPSWGKSRRFFSPEGGIIRALEGLFSTLCVFSLSSLFLFDLLSAS